MIELLKKYKEIILYLIFGGLTTLVNLVSYFVLREVFSIGINISTVIGWFLSVVFAFFTNKYFVFEATNNDKKGFLVEITGFFSARILSLLLDMLILFIFVTILKFNEALIKIISNIFVIIFNYFASKFFIFKKNG